MIQGDHKVYIVNNLHYIIIEFDYNEIIIVYLYLDSFGIKVFLI